MRLMFAARAAASLTAVAIAVCALAEDRIVTLRQDALMSMGITTDAVRGPKTLRFRAERTASLENRYIHRRTLETMGGILFMATAAPVENLRGSCPTIEISLDAENGRRLTLKFPGRSAAHSEIYDWELVPTVDFMKSGDDGLFSYMGYEAEYHPAFNNTLVGVELFLLDTSRDNVSFPYAHLLLESDDVPGFPQTPPAEEAEWDWIDDVQGVLGTEQLLFSDQGVSYTFDASGSSLMIDGQPYWMSVTDPTDGDLGTVLEKFDGETGLQLSSSNPVIYGSITRVARHVALFNFLSEECPAEWNDFVNVMAEMRSKLDTISIPNEWMPTSIN